MALKVEMAPKVNMDPKVKTEPGHCRVGVGESRWQASLPAIFCFFRSAWGVTPHGPPWGQGTQVLSGSPEAACLLCLPAQCPWDDEMVAVLCCSYGAWAERMRQQAER